MLRLIGLVVVVLLVLSLAHGERTGSAVNRLNAGADNIVDGTTGLLADGVRALGDALFGPADPGGRSGDFREVARSFDSVARSTDTASRRLLAQAVLRSCPSLGLVCRPAADPEMSNGRGPRPLPNP